MLKSDRRYGLTGISWIIVIIPRSLHQPALTDTSQLLTLSWNKLLDDVNTTEFGQPVVAAFSWQADGLSWICELLCRKQGCNQNLFLSSHTLECPRMSDESSYVFLRCTIFKTDCVFHRQCFCGAVISHLTLWSKKRGVWEISEWGCFWRVGLKESCTRSSQAVPVCPSAIQEAKKVKG